MSALPRVPQRRDFGPLVSPPLSLGYRAVPLVVRPPVATVREGCAKGKIGCFGWAKPHLDNIATTLLGAIFEHAADGDR